MNDSFYFKPTCVEWDNRHSALLQDFLTRLEQQAIRYVIMKNDEGLPYINHAKDIDILIEPLYITTATQILKQTCRNYSLTHFKVKKFSKVNCCYGIDIERLFAIHIDLIEGMYYQGFELFSFDFIYQHACKNEYNISVLTPVFASIVLLLHCTIAYKSLKEKYISLIAKTYTTNTEEFNKILFRSLSYKVAAQLVTWLERQDYSAITKQAKWLRLQIQQQAFRRNIWKSCCNILSFGFEKIERFILNKDSQYNIFFSVHAPDGTGKTTFIQAVAESLGFYFVCNTEDLVQINHFRPNLLPNLGAAGEKLKVMKQDTNFTNPHRAKPANFWSSCLRMSYYWLDYLIGTPLILRKNARFYKITIFDRYIYDFLVDPKRSRITLPYWLRRIFATLVKQPKVVFILNAPPEVIYQRKQELTKEEITRQLSDFKHLADTLGKRAHIIDATQTPQTMANNAMTILFDHFATKL